MVAGQIFVLGKYHQLSFHAPVGWEMNQARLESMPMQKNSQNLNPNPRIRLSVRVRLSPKDPI